MSDPTTSTANVILPLLCCFVGFSDSTLPSVPPRIDAVQVTRSQGLHDTDQDGLDDALEAGQYSAFDRVDTDNDGWSDAEELARGSLSTVNSSRPQEQACSIGAAAYMSDGRMHVTVAIYIQSGSSAGAGFEVGMFVRSQMIPLDPSRYAQQMTLKSLPTHDPDQLLVVADLVFPHARLLRSGSMPMYATLRVDQTVLSAAAIDLVLQDNTPMALIGPEKISPLAEIQLGPGVLRRPLGGTQVPAAWSAGEICFQRLESVGSHGALMTQEVTSSQCIDGWDGYCDGASCATSVGTTVDLVDPALLIGG